MSARSRFTRLPRRAGAAALVCAALLAGCGEAPPPRPDLLSAQEVASMRAAPVVPLAWDEVAATFALGGPHTDLQRQLMSKQLIGQVVEWRVKVYDVQSEAGGIQLISAPADIDVPGAVNLMSVYALIPASDAKSLTLLSAAQTGTVLTVRGRVRQMTLRAAVVLAPATVSHNEPLFNPESNRLQP